jgi:hypothetical protein
MNSGQGGNRFVLPTEKGFKTKVLKPFLLGSAQG